MNDGSDILKRIILEQGSCTWANSNVCAACPLSKVERLESGRYMSCIEAIGVDTLSEEEADKKYLEAAIDKLMDLSIDEVLKE